MENKIPEEFSKPVELFSADFRRKLSTCVLKSYEVLFQPWMELPIARPLCLRMNPCISSLLDERQNGKKQKKKVLTMGERNSKLSCLAEPACLPPSESETEWVDAHPQSSSTLTTRAQQSWEPMSSHISTCISKVCTYTALCTVSEQISVQTSFQVYANIRKVSNRYLPF